MSEEQSQALQMLRTSNSIETAEDLAMVLSNPQIPRFGSLSKKDRVGWIMAQIFNLNYLLHRKVDGVNEFDVAIDAESFDKSAITEMPIRNLTLVEIQEAFIRGINGEYGDYYGVTVPSLIGFLKGYLNGEKRRKAEAILLAEEKSKLKAGDELFWKTLAEAKAEGKIELPEFQHSPFEDDKQHQARIAKQRAEIMKLYGKQG